ncbi:histamine H1 receptor [Gouania willdenowi]|uniref:Histamine H1 receptor n=1 Tax=Gouania willdenowi TaxID=441366 RepID=A0A8C5HAB5_GOUWI|nr:histamine H1 receptor [Gouania willdenowi]
METGLDPSTYPPSPTSFSSNSNISFMVIPSGNSTRNNQNTTLHDRFQSAILGVFLGLVSLVTIFMNTLVLYAVKKNKSLHTVGNLYIVSLSVADLIVGTTVMPLNLVYLLEDKWKLGHALCQFWLIMDYVASTASIFSLFILCLDRYRSVRQPLKYLRYRTRGKAYVMISGAWFFSMMWIIPILGWRFFTHVEVKPEEEDKCDTDFRFVTWFKVITAILNFYVPSMSMVFFYTLIYLAVRQHLKSRERIIHPVDSFGENENGLNFQSSPNIIHSPNGEHEAQRKSPKKQKLFDQYSMNEAYSLDGTEKVRAAPWRIHRKIGVKVATKQRFSQKVKRCSSSPEMKELAELALSQSLAPQDVNCPEGESGHHLQTPLKGCPETKQKSEVEGFGNNDNYNNYDSCQALPWPKVDVEGIELDPDEVVTLKQAWQKFIDRSCERIQSLKIHKEQKAAKQLGFIIVTFLMCWIPYFIVFMVMAFCKECVHHDLHMFTIWLGYINSTLNPFIYPLCNHNFKRVFKNILNIKV